MAEQSVDLRSTLAILRRFRRALIGAAALGAAAGVCFVLLRPPMYTSASEVVLPPATQDASGQTITRDAETEIRIASGDPVLGPAGKSLEPPMSVRSLKRHVQITAPTSDVLHIEASAETPGRAEAMARAVAKSEKSYASNAASSITNAQRSSLSGREKDLRASLKAVNGQIQKTTARKNREDPASAEGKADATALAQLTAQQARLVLEVDDVRNQAARVQPGAVATILTHATPAKRPGLVSRLVISAFLGLLAALVVAATAVLVFGRRDHHLRYRDEVADAVGSAVIASIRSRVPRAVAGWISLLEEYAPGTVDAWSLRQALRQLVLGDTATGRRHPGQGESKVHHPMSILVLTLSDDLRALAIGPQIASFAASIGIRTRLTAAQGHESAAALWAACAHLPDDEEVRPGLLVTTHPDVHDTVELTVVLAIVDRRKPELVDLPETSVTVLAVSSGSATAEDLAQAAVTADDAGRPITGVVVADPDDLDRTTGRLLQLERSHQVPLPTRLTGMPSTKTGRTNVSRPRRRPG